MPLTMLTAVLVVTTVAAVVQGSLGLGLALVASPGLSMVDPAFVPLPILVAALVASLWTMVRDQRHGLAPSFGWTLIGIPLGIPVGILLLQSLSSTSLMLMLGLSVLALAPLAAMRLPALRVGPASLGVGGFLSALAGTTVGLTGPTVAVVYHELEPAVLRFTMAVYLTIVQTIAIAALLVSGMVTATDLRLVALAIPGTALGLMLSGRVAARLKPAVARRAVIVVCAVAGLSVTVRALIDLFHD